MKEEKYSFIIEFDEITKEQMNSLTDYFNDSKIKFQVLKSDYELKKQDKLEQALDEIENYLKGAYEMATYSKSFMLDKDNVDELLDIINKAKGNDE